MEEQAVMFRSGLVSLALSLALGLLALFVVSGNVVLALLASACMISVITIFLGAMELMGWTLGVLWALHKPTPPRGGCTTSAVGA
jgi:hypothetical protein